MKKLIFLLFPIIAFAQPNKIESVLLENNTLFQINTNGAKIPKGTVMFSPNLLLDINGNWKIKPDIVTIDNLSDNNIVFAFRSAILKNSDNNQLLGENIYIENTVGSFISSTDATVKNSRYATVTGDAQRGWGEGYFMSGFGNTNVGDYNTLIGLNNSIGNWSTGQKYHYSLAIGNRLTILSNYVNASGFNTTFTEEGWGYGYNGVKFWVYEDGRVNIGGINYQFPTVAPQVGDVLQCVAPGVLAWRPSTVVEVQNKKGYMVWDVRTAKLLYFQKQ